MALTPAKSNVWVDRAFTGCNLAMVVGISYLSVKMFFLLLEPGSVQAPPSLFGQSSSSGAGQQQSSVATIDPSAIPVWNLFGREGETKAVASVQKDVDAPKTSLQLELQGVFVAIKEENSSAIIAERMREAKLYRIGDKLPGNATLAGVFPDRVLLNTMGRTEALYFPDMSQVGGVQSNGPRGPGGFAPVSNSRGEPSMGRGGMSSLGPGSNFGMAGGMPGGMPAADDLSKAIKDELGSNPQEALSEMGLEMNGGNGYRVGGGNAQMFSALGVRPGDIIKSINGRPLGNPEADMNMIEEFSSADSLDVNYERDGKPLSTSVSTR